MLSTTKKTYKLYVIRQENTKYIGQSIVQARQEVEFQNTPQYIWYSDNRGFGIKIDLTLA